MLTACKVKALALFLMDGQTVLYYGWVGWCHLEAAVCSWGTTYLNLHNKHACRKPCVHQHGEMTVWSSSVFEGRPSRPAPPTSQFFLDRQGALCWVKGMAVLGSRCYKWMCPPFPGHFLASMSQAFLC
jgi:hypothetical protein